MDLDKLKELGLIHKKIRIDIEDWLDNNYSKNIQLLELATYIETLIENNTKDQRSLNRNIAFPLGLNNNNVVAHYTPNNNSTTLFNKANDMLKIDYGIHYNGNIIDSAFTYSNNTELNPIKYAAKEAVSKVIKASGADARLLELSELATEIIESYEYKNKPLSIVNNVASHNIELYKIHGDKLIYGNTELQKKHCSEDVVMKENECYAIEFYATNGNNNIVMDETNISHYMVNNYDLLSKNKTFSKNANLLKSCIINNFQSLPFCKRYINIYNPKIKINRAIKELFNNNNLISYPPIIDKSPNTYVSQFEDTIYITEGTTINLSNNSE
tara:strand:- start:25590 stop:26573 length:984 start_codon:yes stop_codon:yes gene_type:complete